MTFINVGSTWVRADEIVAVECEVSGFGMGRAVAVTRHGLRFPLTDVFDAWDKAEAEAEAFAKKLLDHDMQPV